MNDNDRLLRNLHRAVLGCIGGVIGLGVVMGALIVRLTAGGDPSLRVSGLSGIATIAFGIACAVPTILAIEIAVKGMVHRHAPEPVVDRAGNEESTGSDHAATIVTVSVEMKVPGQKSVTLAAECPDVDLEHVPSTRERIAPTSRPSRLVGMLRFRS